MCEQARYAYISLFFSGATSALHVNADRRQRNSLAVSMPYLDNIGLPKVSFKLETNKLEALNPRRNMSFARVLSVLS